MDSNSRVPSSRWMEKKKKWSVRKVSFQLVLEFLQSVRWVDYCRWSVLVKSKHCWTLSVCRHTSITTLARVPWNSQSSMQVFSVYQQSSVTIANLNDRFMNLCPTCLGCGLCSHCRVVCFVCASHSSEIISTFLTYLFLYRWNIPL